MKHQITQHNGNSLPSLGADKVSKQLTKKKNLASTQSKYFSSGLLRKNYTGSSSMCLAVLSIEWGKHDTLVL